MNTVYTIGHSTRDFEDFIKLLKENSIELLIDVRRHPGSRRHPQFSKGNLEDSLSKESIDYQHWEVLGGRRGNPENDSVNDGWKSNGFQVYADYINTPDVQEVIDQLVELSHTTTPALMCAEAVFWRCHRQLIADALVARGVTVQHIMGPGQLNEHSLNDMGQVLKDGKVIYPSKQQKLFDN